MNLRLCAHADHVDVVEVFFLHAFGVPLESRGPLKLADNPDGDEEVAETSTAASVAAAWPKKLPEQIAAIRDRVARTRNTWTLDKVCAAFKALRSAVRAGLLRFDARSCLRWDVP